MCRSTLCLAQCLSQISVRDTLRRAAHEAILSDTLRGYASARCARSYPRRSVSDSATYFQSGYWFLCAAIAAVANFSSGYASARCARSYPFRYIAWIRFGALRKKLSSQVHCVDTLRCAAHEAILAVQSQTQLCIILACD